MGHDLSGEVEQEKIAQLTKIIQRYTSVTEDFKEAYAQLQRQVAGLNVKLEEKNQKLRESLAETRSLQRNLTNILSSMNAAVICTDKELKITIFNRAAEELTGYSKDQVIGKSYLEVFPSENETQWNPKKILAERRPVNQQEKYVQRRGGEIIPVKFSMSILMNDENEPDGLVEVMEDLSEFRRLEREIHQARTLIALGELAGHVAHKMRNPLGAVAGFTTLLERDMESNDSRRRYIRKIMEAVGNMERIIGNLVFLTRPVQPSLRKINIRWLLNDVLDHIEFQAQEEGRSVKIERKLPKRKIEILADPHLFQQMFLHLLRNAVESISEEGSIKLQLRKTKAGEVKISISDTGDGIPVEVQKRLFYPFAGSKNKGVGLGLPIVRKIVELHKGKIEVKTRLNRGTKVSLSFPVQM